MPGIYKYFYVFFKFAPPVLDDNDKVTWTDFDSKSTKLHRRSEGERYYLPKNVLECDKQESDVLMDPILYPIPPDTYPSKRIFSPPANLYNPSLHRVHPKYFVEDVDGYYLGKQVRKQQVNSNISLF